MNNTVTAAAIYMNNAATSWPKPACVSQAVSEALILPPGSMHRGGLDSFDVFDAVRSHLAPLLGISDPSQIALGANATWGLNLAIFGFPFEPGDTVVTTKAEHNSVLRPLYALEQKGLIHVHYVDTDETGRVPLAAWENCLQKLRPRLAIFTHASNVTGAVNDAEAMIAAAKAVHARVLIDASQTLGWLTLQAETWGADMVAFTGHKYLLGPQGTGGLWVRNDLTLQPHLLGGTGIQSDRDTMPKEMPLHLEAGTGNEPSFYGLLSALQWQENNPPDISACTQRLKQLRQGLTAVGARVITPSGECTPVVSFTLSGESVVDTGFMLQESCGIICRTGLHCAPKIFSCLRVPETVRLSLSRFTTMEEIRQVISAVEDIRG